MSSASAVFEKERKRFPGIHPDVFTTTLDRATLEKLRSLPLLPQILKKFNDLSLDRWWYVHNMSQSVRCGPNQYSTLYAMLKEACEILDMEEPELYVRFSPIINAGTAGMERPFITVNSALLDHLSDEELLYVIGHELGHIKCGHVLYMTLAIFLFPLLEALGRRFMGLGDIAFIGLVLAFYEWAKQAEISCDRAGAMTIQNYDVSIDAIIRLASGSTRFANEINREEFLEQARKYQDADPLVGLQKIFYWLYQTATTTHPQPIFRAQQLDRWFGGQEYKDALEGDYRKT